MDRDQSGVPGNISRSRRRLVLRRSALLIVGGGISISLLFWAKLRVVTNIPRTTYAEPAGQEQDNGRDAVEAQELAVDERDEGDDRR